MPIIKNKKGKHISSIKIKLNPVILGQIESYCQWAGIYDLGYFFEKAANNLYFHDPEWLIHQQLKETILEAEAVE